jgi:hypothetical protein
VTEGFFVQQSPRIYRLQQWHSIGNRAWRPIITAKAERTCRMIQE